MSARRKFSIFLAPAVCTLIATPVAVWLGAFTPAAPSSWKSIHVDMSRQAVLSLAGPPQKSGWPENVVEVWEKKGLVCHHRMVIWYDAWMDSDGFHGYVRDVSEGTWLRGYGWLHPRQEFQQKTLQQSAQKSGIENTDSIHPN